jgi:hypothetical protein
MNRFSSEARREPERTVKFAYYISAHHKPYQFRWIYSAISDQNDLILVHVDKKTPARIAKQILSIVSGRENVVILPRRSVNWGGWSQVTNELRAIRTALAIDRDWKYFINLSGQCYPIKSRHSIRQTLEAAYPRNYIRCWPFDDIALTRPDDPHLYNRAHVEIFGAVRALPFKLPRRLLGSNCKGTQWHQLSREFCEWLASAPVVRRLGWTHRFSLVPDELFFQAAIMNSPYRHLRMDDAARFFIFPGPQVLRAADLDRIFASDALFARKFDAEIDRDPLDAIAERCGYPAC